MPSHARPGLQYMQDATHHGDEEEVVRQEGHAVDLDVVAQAVQLRPNPVVDVHVLLLRHRKHRLVV
jgi:hypothetical protein